MVNILPGERSSVPAYDEHDKDRPHPDGASSVGRGLCLVALPLQRTGVADNLHSMGRGLYFVALILPHTVVADSVCGVGRVGASSCCLILTMHRRS